MDVHLMSEGPVWLKGKDCVPFAFMSSVHYTMLGT